MGLIHDNGTMGPPGISFALFQAPNTQSIPSYFLVIYKLSGFASFRAIYFELIPKKYILWPQWQKQGINWEMRL